MIEAIDSQRLVLVSLRLPRRLSRKRRRAEPARFSAFIEKADGVKIFPSSTLGELDSAARLGQTLAVHQSTFWHLRNGCGDNQQVQTVNRGRL
jgi:hypothetical protein